MRTFRLPARRDRVIAGALFVAVAVELATNHETGGPYAVDLAFYGSAALLLGWRRVAPLSITTVVWALLLAGTLAGTSVTVLGTALLFVALPSYVVGHETDDRRTWLALAYSVGMLVAITSQTDPFTFGTYGAPVGLLLVAFVCGRLLRNRMLLTRALADETARLELDRELRAQAAIGEERAAIARDMHDVVAHTMAIMVVQAGAARRVLARDPDAALQALATVEETGRTAMTELRRMLGFLRDDGIAELAPQPSLDALEDLVARTREAGLPVELHRVGPARELPQASGLAVYRIVQEALTNTLKHAGPGARATVALTWTHDDLAIEVTDTGRGAGAAPGGGHGLVGMRERVAMHGGELEAGAQPGGGFAVRARLPLAQAVAA